MAIIGLFQEFQNVTRRYVKDTGCNKADAHFASKNTLLKRNTLLLKSLTHFASKSTLQSHDLLLSTPCSLTPFATQNPLLLITPCSSTLFASHHPLLPGAIYYWTHFALWTEMEIIPFIHLDKHMEGAIGTLWIKFIKNYSLPLHLDQNIPGSKVFQGAKWARE